MNNATYIKNVFLLLVSCIAESFVIFVVAFKYYTDSSVWLFGLSIIWLVLFYLANFSKVGES